MKVGDELCDFREWEEEGRDGLIFIANYINYGNFWSSDVIFTAVYFEVCKHLKPKLLC